MTEELDCANGLAMWAGTGKKIEEKIKCL